MSAFPDEDPLNYLIDLENGCSDPEMKDDIQKLRLLVSILRPFLRFLLNWSNTNEFVEDIENPLNVVQKLSCSFELLSKAQHLKPAEFAKKRIVELLSDNLKTLKGLKRAVAKIVNNLASYGYCIFIKKPHLVCYFDSLLQNLNDIRMISSARRTINQREQLEAVEDRLRYLKNFVFLIRVPFSSLANILVEISYKLFLCFVDDDKLVVGVLIKEFKSLLLDHKQFCGRSCLTGPRHYRLTMDKDCVSFLEILISKVKLLSTEGTFMDGLKVQVRMLADELRSIARSSLLEMLFDNSIRERELESLRISITSLIMDTGFFIYFFPDTVLDEESTMTNDWSLSLHDSLEDVENFHQQAADVSKKLIFLSLQSNCPGSNEWNIIDSLVEKVEKTVALIYPVNNEIVMLNERLLTLRKCLGVAADQMGNSQIEFLLTRFKHAACQAEYILDLMADEKSLWLAKLGIFVMESDIKILQKDVETYLQNLDTGVRSMYKTSIRASRQIHQSSSFNAPGCSNDGMQFKIEDNVNELIGREDAVTDMVGLLTEGSSQLKILSIVGMAGLGKSALANAVYMHSSVDTYFQVRAWGRLSQVYQKETLLSSLIGQICKENTIDQIQEISGEDFDQMLYQNLKRKKYLIVLDNVWDIEIWNDLRLCFPDDENGSRILFTTRNHDVAAKANSFPYALRLLSSEESCELLWLKLFKRETRPQHLSSISKRIAYCCKGLPLAVILVAGTLNTTKKAQDSWEKVAKTFIRSQSIQEAIWEILKGSYKLLPDHLKPCFWYFGTFPGGTRISVSKMMRLWISEGFIQQPNPGGKSLLQEAESYLNDLIHRSLVLVARKSSKGGVKECYVHDILQEFCSAKLKQKRYEMQERIAGGISVLCGDFIRPEQSLFGKFSTTKDLNIRSLMYYSMSDVEKDMRGRVDLPEQEESRDSPPRIESDNLPKEAMFSDLRYTTDKTHPTDKMPKKGIGISRHNRLHYSYVLQYKYLKVLDLANVLFRDGADTYALALIAELVHLTYLAVKICTDKIPSEIANLRSLEFLHLSGAIGRIILPAAMWKLVCLQDVIMDHCFFSFQHYSPEFFEDSSQMVNLKSLSTIHIWHGNAEKLMRMLAGVQKLGCIFSNSWQEFYEVSNLFKIFESLHELQSLKMSFLVRAPYHFSFGFPLKLKKLALSNSRLPWDEISVIGQLHNLEVLKLLSKAFEGRQWNMRESEFKKLKFLKLESLDIEEWDASSDQLPCLEQLVVISCQQLQEIPSGFGEISTLQSIELKWCSASAAHSVKQILDDQRDYGNHQFNVIVSGVQRDSA